jgi:hypothetical protein
MDGTEKMSVTMIHTSKAIRTPKQQQTQQIEKMSAPPAISGADDVGSVDPC